MCFHFVIFTWLDNKRYIKSSPYNVFFPGFPAPSHVLSRLSELRGESDVISCLIRARFSSLLLGEFSPAALKPVSKTLFFRVKSSSLQTFPLILQLHRRVHRRGGGGPTNPQLAFQMFQQHATTVWSSGEPTLTCQSAVSESQQLRSFIRQTSTSDLFHF